MIYHHPTNFLELIRVYKTKHPIYTVITNLEDGKDYKIGLRSDSVQFSIIYDPRYKDSPMNYPDHYYCNTFEELLSIINFTKKKNKLYYTE